MEKFYIDGCDVHVGKYVVFGKTADHKLYKKLVGTTYSDQITQAELEDVFKKGLLLIKVGDAFYEAIMLNGNKASTLAKTGEPTATFDATKTYNVGDCVWYSGTAYKCKTQISVAAAWDATKWDEITTVDFVEWAASVPSA